MWKKLLLAMMASMVLAAPAMAAGTLKIDGSTSVYPLAEKLIPQYNLQATAADKIEFTLTKSDSQGGIDKAENGTVDIGNASRNKKSTDPADLVFTKICKDAVGIVVKGGSNSVNLTNAQVTAIFNGTISNWSQIPNSGKTGAIQVYTRENGSGTLDFFNSTFMTGTAIKSTAIVTNGNQAMHDAVKADPNGIGFVGMEYLDTQVTAYNLNGYAPTVANVQSGAYTASRDFNMVTKGAPANNAKLFIDWILSPAGQTCVQQDGEVPLPTTSRVATAASAQSHHDSHHTSH